VDLPFFCIGGYKGCWSGVLVGQIAGGWRFTGVVVAGMHGSSHQQKRSQRVDIAYSLVSLVVEEALLMALETASRLWTMVLAGVTVGMVR
jgi:hypothetical protein